MRDTTIDRESAIVDAIREATAALDALVAAVSPNGDTDVAPRRQAAATRAPRRAPRPRTRSATEYTAALVAVRMNRPNGRQVLRGTDRDAFYNAIRRAAAAGHTRKAIAAAAGRTPERVTQIVLAAARDA